MKLTLALLALTASGISSVFGVPALQTSNVTTLPAPQGFTPFDVSESVDAAPAPSSPAHKDALVAAASAQYWVCITVSTSTLTYGWSQGGSESAALQNAKNKCGKGDCTSYSCVEEGCVGIDYGSTYVALSYAVGYGTNDGSKAASLALSKCQANSQGVCKGGVLLRRADLLGEVESARVDWPVRGGPIKSSEREFSKNMIPVTDAQKVP
ncbi:DUF4189 domain-containing protein [Mycena sanguinolenta]|uniref:DUF4189 domain-containing protein n=1 Tax=Mycena sanguinolenta TaxID=230812 RepID=A0A8H7DFC9_9AGAR|nr:DUF4189 domain-containing protein [Mycena sanguinolenta]